MEQPRHSSDFQETDPGLAHPVPFEAPERHPRFADRLQATFRLGFRHPATFAARLALRKDVLPAWFFSVVVALPFHALAFLLGRATFRLISGPAHSRLTHALLAQIPVLLLAAFALALIFHAGLWMAGGTRQRLGYRQTFRMTAYAWGFYAPLAWLPPVNLILLPLWIGYLGFTLARLHRTEVWRGVVAVAAPFLAFWCLVMPTLAALPARTR